MNQPIFFTTKVATGKTFCNRIQESHTLMNNIKKNQHTVIVGPRRYGKTSLVAHTLEKMQYPFARIDLFCVVYEEDICRKVAKSISVLIRQLTSFSEKTLSFLQQCFKSAYVTFSAGQIEIKVDFGQLSDPMSQLEDLLEGLERLAQKHQKQVVLFFDEFQDVLKIDATNKVQAAIRAIAQHAKYVNYIFSGSSRQMLHKIFDDKHQPLYMLCKKLILERISPVAFKEHIDVAAKANWRRVLPEELVAMILSLTESHPYYVNLLCDKVWESEKLPDTNLIHAAWCAALTENQGKIIADLEPLNTNRLKVLLTVALMGAVSEPNSKVFLEKVKLPLSSTQNAVKYLMNEDYLFHSEMGLKLVDPLMRQFIIEHYA